MKCLQTGKAVVHGNNFSSPEAAEAYRIENDRLSAELIDKGFTRIDHTPNLFIKDGAGVTLEGYKHDPVATLAHHAERSAREINRSDAH